MPSPKSNLGICSRILRPMQKTKGICWFLAYIVIMFYSQRSRRVIMDSANTWDTQGVFLLFRNLLYDRYLTVGSDPHKSEEHTTFNENTIIEILQELYDMDKSRFPYNPKDNIPHLPQYADSYLYKLYNLLGIDCKMFDYIPSLGRLYYSSFNKDFDGIDIFKKIPGVADVHNPDIGVYIDDKHPPSILIIATAPTFTPFTNNKIDDGDIKSALTSMKQKITYNGFVYILDSVYLTNENRGSCNHAIVGMTCKQKKFVYNGQPFNGTRNFPCKLMHHNWDIRNDKNFYLSYNHCILYPTPQKPNELRFNFSKGNRKFIYVRKNASSDTSASLEEDVKKYLETRAISREIKEARLRYEEESRRTEERIYEIDALAAIMSDLKLDDKHILLKIDTKRKRKSSSTSNSIPKPKKKRTKKRK